MDTKIPLAIGFANFMGVEAQAMMREDVEVLSVLFQDAIVAPDGKLPATPILFFYARLSEDGTIQGVDHMGVRQIVRQSGAQTLILASQNTDSSILKTASLPGPKTANLIFTNNRNGEAFADFFYRLFEYMRDGCNMLDVWAVMASQAAKGIDDEPGMILLAEAGKLVFPQAVEA